MIIHITKNKGQQNKVNVAKNNELNKVRVCKSHVYFFKFDYKNVSEIETISSENVHFLGGFSDARICVELKFFLMKLE